MNNTKLLLIAGCVVLLQIAVLGGFGGGHDEAASGHGEAAVTEKAPVKADKGAGHAPEAKVDEKADHAPAKETAKAEEVEHEAEETHATEDAGHAKSGFDLKPSPDEVIAMLKAGNERFVQGKSTHPHLDSARLIQAGKENQGNHAYATVITCSDSRVPVEAIFDAGIMDVFVIRVAGNVCDVDETGSIEYGLAHVNTPVLVVLGHTQCGAVTAVTHAVQGRGHALERNIPPLVDNIVPAVNRAMESHSDLEGDLVIPFAIEENVWQGMEDLFLASPATRNLVTEGKAKVVGAIYDVGTGKIKWLPEEKTLAVMKKIESNPARAIEPMAN